MRKTKIVCTIGPASEREDIIVGMCKAGMNVARLNFSHNTHADHERRIELIKKVRSELNLPVAIMLDTKGPEYRIKTFESGKITLNEGAEFVFTTCDVIGNEHIVSVSYPNLPKELAEGDSILLNNGLLTFIVDKIENNNIICKVVCGGELSDRKSMSFPGKVMKQPYLSEQDKKDIKFGVERGIDFIACSFVSGKQDLIDVHNYLDEIGANNIELIAKIENQSGFDNIDEICEYCDGVMVARGDMGVEIPFEQLPNIQKKLITKCRMLGKRVITATEMLESMIHSPRPTRAEISDVANAVYDGTSAIMLSGETAAGKYPVEAVRTMAKIAETTEENINYKKRFNNAEFTIKNTVDAISHATCCMAIDINAKAIVACSISGMTARMVSRFRSPIDIIGLTTDEATWRKLALSWGVIPALCEKYPSTDVLFYTAKKITAKSLSLKKGDKIIITGGDTSGRVGNTNLIKVEEM
ncbi:MAG: pyruvate kinase [Clostridia bacterium]|nr:pyruvate kinase [Clostridia bacterium]MBQ8146399.1 pyruvate kinase [Clostridia bacterium]MBQ8768021.1 pyruvate kinase [Clostridia bacterium]